MKQLNEGLNYQDMVGHVTPLLSIDEFSSRIGDDSEIIVLTFIVSAKAVGDDLVDWLERGYDWIIDAEVSPGEVLDKKWYVFAEMNRRTSAPRRIIELLEDLYTLTDIKLSDWEIKLDNKKYPADIQSLEKNLICNSAEYKNKREGDLNEWREIAGLKTVNTHDADPDLTHWKRIAGVL